MGQCWDSCRHRGVCGGEYSAVVAVDGEESIPTSKGPAHLRRQRREQWLPLAFMETRAAEAGQPAKAHDYGVSLSARNKQVEQDGASPFFVHQHELARAPSDGLPDRCQFNCCHDDKSWADDQSPAGQEYLPTRHQGLARRAEENRAPSARIPWRVELYDQSKLTNVYIIMSQGLNSGFMAHRAFSHLGCNRASRLYLLFESAL